jgi:MOSC domain-containing protein YiiM
MKVTGLYAGKPQAFGPRNSPSSIIKQPHPCLQVVEDGALEDEQGNKKLHGGAQMALHQFALTSYAVLAKAFPNLTEQFIPGSIGENISAPDMTDENVYIGDIYRYGETLLQVSSPRAPCAKINQRYGYKKIDLFILNAGITGWYFRVLEDGKINLDDSITLVDRNNQAISVKTLMHMTKAPEGLSFSKTQLEEALHSPGLAPEWQDKLRRKIVKTDLFQ